MALLSLNTFDRRMEYVGRAIFLSRMRKIPKIPVEFRVCADFHFYRVISRGFQNSAEFPKFRPEFRYWAAFFYLHLFLVVSGCDSVQAETKSSYGFLFKKRNFIKF